MARRIDLDDTKLRANNGNVIGRFEDGRIFVELPINPSRNGDLDYLRPAILAVRSVIDIDLIRYVKIFGRPFEFLTFDGRVYMKVYYEFIIFEFEFEGPKEVADRFVKILLEIYPECESNSIDACRPRRQIGL